MNNRFLSILLVIPIVIFLFSGKGLAVVDDKEPGAHETLLRADPQGNMRPETEKNAEAEKYKDGELLVKFRPGVPEEKKNSLHRKHGSEKIKEFRSLRLHHIKLKKGLSVEEAVEQYKADSDVEYAEPNFSFTIQTTPNDPGFPTQWGLYNTIYLGVDIDAPHAWNMTTGSSAVVIAVIDSGVDYNHQDLAGNMWTNTREVNGTSGMDDDNNGYVDDVYGIDTYNQDSDPMDDHYHGTHVAGIIGAVGNNAIGIAGVNWNVQIMPCKFIGAAGYGYTDGAVACLQYVKAMKDRGVNIVATNNSWGGDAYSQSLCDAINAQREILFIAAAGNDGTDSNKLPFYPANYDLPNVISVASFSKSGAMSSFSNYGGRTVYVGAPGEQIYSTTPGNTYQSLSGTSMAAPHAAGLAALLMAQDPERDWKTIKNLILSGGVNTSAMNSKTITGKRINAYGSMTCSNSSVFAVLDLPSNPVIGAANMISALSINCGAPVGPATATLGGGGTIQLYDDGMAPDLEADDGIFTGTWKPTSGEVETLTFTSSVGSKTVASPPIIISDSISISPPASIIATKTTSAPTGTWFSQAFSASNGVPPITWSIVSGSLPTGLSIGGSSGVISGTPTQGGIYEFTVQATDGIGMTDTKSWTILVGKGLRAGWPQVLENRVGSGFLSYSYSPIFSDMYGDGNQEIVVADVNTLYVFDKNGLVAKTGLSGTISTPVVADINNDGQKEIVVGVGQYYSSSNSIYAFHSDLTPLQGFPSGAYASYNGGPGDVKSVVASDLNNDGKLELIALCYPNNTQDPNYGKNAIVIVDSDGNMLLGWPKFINGGDWGDYPPAVADIDNDGEKEIVFVTTDGYVHIFHKDGTEVRTWQFAQNPSEIWPPVLADVDGDGKLDIIVKHNMNLNSELTETIHVFDRTGIYLTGWPKTFSGMPANGLAAADLDGDGRAEVIFVSGSGWNQLQALRSDGSPLPGWPVTMNNGFASFDSNPIVADINGDGQMKVLINLVDYNTNGKLVAYYPSGVLVSGYPKYTTPGSEIRSTPAIGDLDNNGRADIAIKSEDGMLFVWEEDQASASATSAWPMFRHDAQHTGKVTPVIDSTPDPFIFIDQTNVEINMVVISNSITISGINVPAPVTISGGEYEINGSGLWTSVSGTVVNGNTVLVRQTSSPNYGTTTDTVLTIDGVSDTFSVTTVGIADLMVSSLNAPSTAEAGGTVTITDTTANNGTGASGATLTSYYLSTNTIYDSGDILLGGRAVGALSAGSSSSGSVSVTIPTGTAADSYYIIAVADSGQTVSETDETNNTKAYAITLAVTADLTITAVNTPPPVADGDSVTITDTTTNNGTGVSGISTTRFYLSTNTIYDSGDVLLGSRTVPALAGGASSQGTTVATIPAGTQGIYYLIAVADASGAVSETNETNNTKASSYIKVGIWADFSASITSGSVQFTDLSTGRPTSWSWTFGDGTSSTEQNPLHTYSSAGTYQVKLVVRKVGSLYDSSTNRSITAPAGPDLTVTLVSGPSTAIAGGAATITDTTANIGGGASGTSTTNFYLSTNSTYESSDVLLGSRAVGALSGGASSSVSTSITIPAGTAAGTYYIIAAADSGRTVSETNETNNTRAWPIAVSAPNIMIPGTTPAYFSLLQDAFNGAADGVTIMTQATEFIENIILNRPVSIVISGGYDASFSDNNGTTTIKGSLTIGDGTIKIGSGAFIIY